MRAPVTPQPIRTDPSNWFAWNTVNARFPTNVRNVIEANPDYPARTRAQLAALADSMAGNTRMPEPPFGGFDADAWQALYEPYRGDHWHATEWFFAETYAFRLLLDACDYFGTLRDPYAPFKQAELDSGAAFEPLRAYGAYLARAGVSATVAVQDTVAEPSLAHDLLHHALHACTWGNRADLSFSAGGVVDRSAGDAELLIVNDDAAAVRLLRQRATRGPVHIVMDNSGAELAGDFVLADALHRGLGVSVVFHPKLYPTYVSDTTVVDLHRFLDHADRHPDVAVRELSAVTRARLADGAYRIIPDDYWCQTLFWTEMPPRVERTFAGAALVVVKGDFNYRRVMRDTIWAPGVPARAASGLEGSSHPPLLLLRTMKSDCIAGTDGATCAALDHTDPRWRINGKRGVIQLVG